VPRNIFAPPLPIIKSAEFKVKNRRKSGENAKSEHALESFYPF